MLYINHRNTIIPTYHYYNAIIVGCLKPLEEATRACKHLCWQGTHHRHLKSNMKQDTSFSA